MYPDRCFCIRVTVFVPVHLSKGQTTSGRKTQPGKRETAGGPLSRLPDEANRSNQASAGQSGGEQGLKVLGHASPPPRGQGCRSAWTQPDSQTSRTPRQIHRPATWPRLRDLPSPLHSRKLCVQPACPCGCVALTCSLYYEANKQANDPVPVSSPPPVHSDRGVTRAFVQYR